MSILIKEPELLLDAKSPLGEAPIWDVERQVLWWTDILRGVVHCYTPADGSNRTWEIGQMVGTLVTAKSGGLVLAAQNGFLHFDPETGETKVIVDPEPDKPGNRFNDGKCDPAGRLWAGTMPITEDSATGSMYCLHPDGHVEKQGGDYSIPNGIVWNAEATVMYHIDSPTRRVDAWDFDNSNATISNRRTAIEIQDEGAFPDGMAMDVEGKIWVALWSGWSVVRFDPENGEELARIPVPVSRTSACAFGGPNLDDLYITTAKKNITEADLEKEPLAGCVFKARVDVSGLPPVSFAG